MKICFQVLTVLTFLVNVTTFGQTRQLERQKSPNPQTTQKRVALVIGNSAYKNASELLNPANDATDMAQTLKDLGFEVISGTNQTKAQMQNLIRQFGNRLADTKAVGLFFYAGHGIAQDGTNYLIPVDADIQAEDEIEESSVSINFVLNKMSTANNGFNIVILDACRNNPFSRKWRNYRDVGNSGGLTRMDAPTGTLIAYATKPGDVASDGTGRNGLYTGALLKQMRVKNMDITKVFQRVRANVIKQSNGKQVPFDESSVVGDFYLAGIENNTPVHSPNNKMSTDNSDPNFAKTADAKMVEREIFRSIQNSTDIVEIRAVLEEYPNSQYAAGARLRLEQIVWNSVKDSKVKTKIQAYLDEFKAGANAPLARIKLKQLDALTMTSDTALATKIAGTISKMSLPNGVEISFAYIPEGIFQMGSINGNSDEKPIHKITIRQGFFMGRTEVTQAQWQAVMGSNPSYFKDCLQCPVEQVSWYDAQSFIDKLNAQNDGFRYRLPTEAEWEYAARAGTTGDYAGDLDSMAWYEPNSNKKTHPVANKQANAWGLYDMHGNVWEWCQDWYVADYYSNSPDINPMGATSGKLRVVRGGGWFFPGEYPRSAFRGKSSPSVPYFSLGFRVVRE